MLMLRNAQWAIVLSATSWAAAANATNIVANSEFETGAGADAASWNEIEVAGGSLGATAIADRTLLSPRTGLYGMDLAVVGAADFGPVAEIQQQTAVGSVTPGSTYDFSYWLKGVPGPGSVSFFEVLWFDGDGSNGGGPQGSATGLNPVPLNPTYTQISALGLVAPAGADSVLFDSGIAIGNSALEWEL